MYKTQYNTMALYWSLLCFSGFVLKNHTFTLFCIENSNNVRCFVLKPHYMYIVLYWNLIHAHCFVLKPSYMYIVLYWNLIHVGYIALYWNLAHVHCFVLKPWTWTLNCIVHSSLYSNLKSSVATERSKKTNHPFCID